MDQNPIADNPPDEWPAEPWVVSGPGEVEPNEIGCIYQEGEVEPIAVVDPNRENADVYVQSTARRIVACVNAMAGIEDPEDFVKHAAAMMPWRNSVPTSAQSVAKISESTDGR